MIVMVEGGWFCAFYLISVQTHTHQTDPKPPSALWVYFQFIFVGKLEQGARPLVEFALITCSKRTACYQKPKTKCSKTKRNWTIKKQRTVTHSYKRCPIPIALNLFRPITRCKLIVDLLSIYTVIIIVIVVV